MAPVETELEDQLMEAGNRLLTPPYAAEELLPLLDQVENCLSRVEQSPTESMQTALAPSMKALVAGELLRHSDMDVKVAVACCISEITRITAPDAPYADELMKEIFQMIVASFEKLYDVSCPSYLKRVSILETVAKVRSCVVMLDLECDDLILEMFNHFLKAIRESHPDNIFSSMETIMTLVLEESEDVSPVLLSSLLSSVRKENQDILPIARRLGEKVIVNCTVKIKPYLMQEVKSKGISLDDYSNVVASICQDTFDAQDHSKIDATGQRLANENKLSETTGSDEPSLGAGKVEPEVACPGEVDPTVGKSPTAVISNGILQGGDDNSLQPISPEKKLDHSHRSDPSEMIGATSEGEPGHSDSKIVKPESSQEQATKKKRAQKTNSLAHSTDTSDHSRVECENEAVELPSRKRGRSKENLVSEGGLVIEEATGPSEVGKKPRPSSPTGSPNENVTVASPTPSQNDAAFRKRGRPTKKKDAELDLHVPPSSPKKKEGAKKKKEGANTEVDSHVPPSSAKKKKEGVNTEVDSHIPPSSAKKKKEGAKKKKEGANAEVDLHVPPSSPKDTLSSGKIEDGLQQSTDVKLKKESEGNSDTEAKLRRRSGKKVHVGSANVDEKLPATITNSNKESEGTSDLEAKPPKRSGKKVLGENATKGESSAKQKGEKGPPKIETGVNKDLGKKKTVSSPKSAAKSSLKDESHLEETPKTEPKRKRVPATEKASEKSNHVEDLGENIVGRNIEVWWPTDKAYYNGVVESYDPVGKKHKIVYDDGDVEILLLKKEKWKFIDSVADEEKQTDLPSPDASEMPPKKKIKTSSDSQTKQPKTDSSLKRGRGASEDKPKGDGTKAASKSDDDASRSRSKSAATKSGSKSIEDTPKVGSKSKENKSSKLKDDSPKTASKSKETPKASNKLKEPKTGSKSKEAPNASGKSKEAPNASGKSKEENAKSGSKANGSSTKGKSGLLKVTKSNDSGKGKLGSTMVQESEGKGGKKKRGKAQD